MLFNVDVITFNVL